MQSHPEALKFLVSAIFAFAFSFLVCHGRGEICNQRDYGPTARQTRIGFQNPPKYRVEVQNNCPMCPVINIHMACGNFSQTLVKPSSFIVLKYNDCIVNAGLPLGPLQKFAFSYTHHKYNITPSFWNFQCE